MVLERRIAELLQSQAERFLKGFNANQLSIGLLSGRLELSSLALNPDPFDTMLLEGEVPLCVKAGMLMSAVLQVHIMQGEIELIVDGLNLVLAPMSRWLDKDEVYTLRTNEIQRLEFVHMRSQCQRRNIEREMFRQLFSDYLCRLKIIVRNVHVRVEIDGEVNPSNRGADAAFGMFFEQCGIIPIRDLKEASTASDKDADSLGEVILAERVTMKAITLYHEPPKSARMYISREAYCRTLNSALGIFEVLRQEDFQLLLNECRRAHAQSPQSEQLMPATNLTISCDLRSQPMREPYHLDGCLTMEIMVRLDGNPSRFNLSLCALEHLSWAMRRSMDFQLWSFLHPFSDRPARAKDRWALVQRFTRIRRRILSNVYSVREALQMRGDCKEYVCLYKRKFNGPASVIVWRKVLTQLSEQDVVRLSEIELLYPADKVVNFRLMAHAELKTELAVNSFLNADESSGGETSSLYRRAARELTPMEQLQLHGQHGYGVNIYRGLMPPPSSLKIRIDFQVSEGLWWTCSLEDPSGSGSRKGRGAASGSSSARDSSRNSWMVALDSTRQPFRISLVDSMTDASVFATIEVPVCSSVERPLAVLLGRTAQAFASGSPGRVGGGNETMGGRGLTEWCSLLEFDGAIYACAQLRTVPSLASPTSAWDIFAHVSCGDKVDPLAVQYALGFTYAINPVAPGTYCRSSSSDFGKMQIPDTQPTACVRLRLPLTMPDGQQGPLADLLPWIRPLASTAPAGAKARGGMDSALAWFAKRISVTSDLAILRVHIRMPELVVEATTASGATSATMPRFDAGLHFEHGGLHSGFVVGLHQLQHFAASLLRIGAMPSAAQLGGSNTSRGSRMKPGGGRFTSDWKPGGGGNGSTPALSLQGLQEAPSLIIIVFGVLASLAVAVGANKEPQQAATRKSQLGSFAAPFLLLAQKLQLSGAFAAGASRGAGDTGDSPLAIVSIVIVCLAVVVARRRLWDCKLHANEASPEVEYASVQSLFAAALAVALDMGFPLHSRCVYLAAWSGSMPFMEVIAAVWGKTSCGAGKPWPPAGALSWAARGSYCNSKGHQMEVIRWLLSQGASIMERDEAGRSLLDWACWADSEDLAMMALRAGLLHRHESAQNSAAVASAVTALTQAAATSRSIGISHPSSRRLPLMGLNKESLPLVHQADSWPSFLSSPLTLAVVGRSKRLTALLLRASGDPHALIRGSLCGPLLLALRNCEFEIASEVLLNAAYVDVEAALGTVVGTASSVGMHLYSSADIADGVAATAMSVRATVAIVDAFVRFGSLLRRAVEEPNTSKHYYQYPYSTPPYNAFNALLGPHPDETLFATTAIPSADVFHPLIPFLGAPSNKVPLEQWPSNSPHSWLRRLVSKEEAWVPARKFLELCVGRGFTPDWAVLARSLPALPIEARRFVQEMFSAEINIVGNIAGSIILVKGNDEDDILTSVSLDVRRVRERYGDESGSVLQNAELIPTLRTAKLSGTSSGSNLQALWLTLATEDGMISADPALADELRIDGRGVTWSLVGEVAPKSPQLSLSNVAALRRYEVQAQNGDAYGRFVVEVRLVEKAELTTLSSTFGRISTRSGESRYVVSFAFTMEDRADAFASQLQAFRQQHEAQHTVDKTPKALSVEAMAHLDASPWALRKLRDAISSTSSSSSSAPATPLPAVRVLVLGEPRSGKTTVAARVRRCLNSKGSSSAAPGDDPWITLRMGTWPGSGRARAEACIWDGAATALPGLLPRLAADCASALLLVVVGDHDMLTRSNPASTFVDGIRAAFAREVGTSAPRRLLIVENCFPGGQPQAKGHADSKTPTKRIVTVRCDLLDAGNDDITTSFVSLMSDLVSDLEAKGSGKGSAPPVAPGSSDPWSGVIVERPPRSAVPDVRSGDRSLAKYIGGDSMLLHPSALAFAWAAICASRGSLDTSGSALVPWAGLEKVLGAADPDAGASAAQAMLRAMADVGLICPIPLVVPMGERRAAWGCNAALIPDFAPRVRLTPAGAARFAGAAGGGASAKGGGAVRRKVSKESSGSDCALSARLVWDQSANGTPPQLRTVLRNFIMQGAVGSSSARGPYELRFISIRSFGLLDADAAMTAGGAAAFAVALDSLSPGFVLVFEWSSSSEAETSKNTSPSLRGAAGSPPKSKLPSPAPAKKRNSLPGSSEELDSALADEALTAVLVRVSSGGHQGPPFWDVYCVGVHAQWAWRALLGTGAASPGFAGFRKVGKPSTSCGEGELLPPACVISTAPQAPSYGVGVEEQPTNVELAGFAWLFNGPLAVSARTALTSSTPQKSGMAALCAAFCGKSLPEEPNGDFTPLATAGTTDPDSSNAEFEAALLARRWRQVPRILDGPHGLLLGGGIERWSLGFAAIARAAHDAAAAAAGPRGRALPLIQSAAGLDGGKSATLCLVPEGPELLMMGGVQAIQRGTLGAVRLSGAMNAWLRLCRPAALWSAAGAHCGFVETPTEGATVPSGAQVSEALQAAFSVHLTEQMVTEVWDALAELDISKKIIQRAGGTWAQVAGVGAGFVF